MNIFPLLICGLNGCIFKIIQRHTPDSVKCLSGIAWVKNYSFAAYHIIDSIAYRGYSVVVRATIITVINVKIIRVHIKLKTIKLFHLIVGIQDTFFCGTYFFLRIRRKWHNSDPGQIYVHFFVCNSGGKTYISPKGTNCRIKINIVQKDITGLFLYFKRTDIGDLSGNKGYAV